MKEVIGKWAKKKRPSLLLPKNEEIFFRSRLQPFLHISLNRIMCLYYQYKGKGFAVVGLVWSSVGCWIISRNDQCSESCLKLEMKKKTHKKPYPNKLMYILSSHLFKWKNKKESILMEKKLRLQLFNVNSQCGLSWVSEF